MMGGPGHGDSDEPSPCAISLKLRPYILLTYQVRITHPRELSDASEPDILRTQQPPLPFSLFINNSLLKEFDPPVHGLAGSGRRTRGKCTISARSDATIFRNAGTGDLKRVQTAAVVVDVMMK